MEVLLPSYEPIAGRPGSHAADGAREDFAVFRNHIQSTFLGSPLTIEEGTSSIEGMRGFTLPRGIETVDAVGRAENPGEKICSTRRAWTSLISDP